MVLVQGWIISHRRKNSLLKGRETLSVEVRLADVCHMQTPAAHNLLKPERSRGQSRNKNNKVRDLFLALAQAGLVTLAKSLLSLVLLFVKGRGESVAFVKCSRSKNRLVLGTVTSCLK